MYRVGMTQAPEQSTAKGWRPDDSSFGARLALVRQHMKWGNVAEAAKACGVPVESWRTWDRDSVVPRRIVEMAGLIADASGCDYEWLLSGPSRSSGRHVIDWNPVKAERTTRPSGHRSRGREVSRSDRPSGRGDSTRPITPRRTSRLPRPDAA
jgi:hypothetical protein